MVKHAHKKVTSRGVSPISDRQDSTRFIPESGSEGRVGDGTLIVRASQIGCCGVVHRAIAEDLPVAGMSDP